ncbi:hypothetical protein O181_054160 [Austropuccinia psidii MF-1]|uniref:Uncharacterized protein n=1 Tax=Austropuccinia psidii MF-1 TaxID=1389203 RepID=A0A9Q3E894_9BASI|nr:hypothetical protein [Austropuccinia psidii MF-1]
MFEPDVTEGELKRRRHLSRLTGALKDASPYLSAWMSLFSGQTDNSSQRSTAVLPARTMWCSYCRSSCRLRVRAKAHHVSVTCRRPSCQKQFFVPLSNWQSRPRSLQHLQRPVLSSSSLSTQAPSSAELSSGSALRKQAPLVHSTAPKASSQSRPAVNNSSSKSGSTDANAPASEAGKNKKSRSKARHARSGLSELLARRKAEQSQPDSGSSLSHSAGGLHNFLTQL